MAAMTFGGGGGGRRAVDAELALVPMIDLLVCCITFLLLTAAWSLMHRLPAESSVGGNDRVHCEDCEKRKLSVEMSQQDDFKLVWREGSAVVSEVRVPRQPVMVERHGQQFVTYPALAAAIDREWRANGRFGDHDRQRDIAVLRAPDRVTFGEMTAVMDAVYGVSRKGRHGGPAFALVLGN